MHALTIIQNKWYKQTKPQADFSFFFDTGGRRRCYLAPERFFEGPPAAIDASAPLTPEMVGGGAAVML